MKFKRQSLFTLTLTPALSPGERKNHSQSLRATDHCDSSEVSRTNQIVRLLFPLPKGEGQGEGNSRFALHANRLTAQACAFTLIELILVMALLAIVLAISSPALSRFFKSRSLDSEARRFMSLTRAAQSRAVSEGVPMVVWVQPKERAYGLKADKSFVEEDPNAEQFVADETLEIEPRHSAEANAASKVTLFKNEKLDATGLYALRFNPDGFVSASSPEIVVFRQKDNGELWVAQSRNRLSYEIQPGKQVASR